MATKRRTSARIAMSINNENIVEDMANSITEPSTTKRARLSSRTLTSLNVPEALIKEKYNNNNHVSIKNTTNNDLGVEYDGYQGNSPLNNDEPSSFSSCLVASAVLQETTLGRKLNSSIQRVVHSSRNLTESHSNHSLLSSMANKHNQQPTLTVDENTTDEFENVSSPLRRASITADVDPLPFSAGSLRESSSDTELGPESSTHMTHAPCHTTNQLKGVRQDSCRSRRLDTPPPSRVVAAVARRTNTISSPQTSSPSIRPTTAINHSPVLPGPLSFDSPSTTISHASTATLKSSKNLELLQRFPEFRALLRDYKAEQRKVQTWANDYSSLLKRHQKLESASFPRPSAQTITYLEELVDCIRGGSCSSDTRSDEQLANDLGIPRIVLVGLEENEPQKASLNVFNHLFPSYEVRVALNSIGHMVVSHKKLLDDILVFAQRCSPGANFTMNKMKEAISGSIRMARYRMRQSAATTQAINLALHHHSADVRDELNTTNDQLQHDMQLDDDDRSHSERGDDRLGPADDDGHESDLIME